MNSWHLDANFQAIRNFLQQKIIFTLQHADHWWQPMPRNQEAEEEEFSERNCNCTFFLLLFFSTEENKAMICVLSQSSPPAPQMYVSSHHRFTSIFRIIQENTLPFLSIYCICISLSRYTTTANTPDNKATARAFLTIPCH